MLTIKKAAVIGAGNMGAQIAAHLANVGIPSLLMDVVPTELTPEEQKRGLTLQDREVRNRVTKTLFERAKKLSPNPFFVPEAAKLITLGNIEDDLLKIADADWVIEAVLEKMDLKRNLHARIAKLITLGNIEDDLPKIADADWVIEAVLEKMDLKRSLHARIAKHASPDAIVTSNTSGLSINGMLEGLSKKYRKRFFGTHFFNPPRYMRLLEIIPNTETTPRLLNHFTEFAENVLGKGIVRCKDTPGFVANRIGCFAMQHVHWLTVQESLGLDEVDGITGRAMGRPASATYRLGDIVGVDLMVQVGQNFSEQLKNDDQIARYPLPDYIVEMVKRGWWGEKKGQGFYKRVKTEKGREILTLDYKTLDYRPQQRAQFPSLETVSKIADPAERLRALCAATDKAGDFAWKHLSATICYAADRLTEIADDVVTVDNAMRWGFNWELGPFEIWDALGVRETVARLEKEGREVPALIRDLLAAGKTAFYETQNARRFFFDLAKRDYVPVPCSEKAISLPMLRKDNKVVRSNAGASLIDLGDDVACLEFHVKMNVIGGDQLTMLKQSLEEVRKNFAGLVIGNQGDHFSAGANLLLVTTQIQNQEWDDINQSIHTFQQATTTLRQFEKPVVSACHSYTLGGGCEITMGSDHVVAAAETYMGLPEVGVGLIPAAGGTKEMLIRCTEHLPRTPDTDYFPGLQHAWETIGMAKVSTSAHEAAKLKYLRMSDATVVLNRDWLIGEAKTKVLQMAEQGYKPKPQRDDLPAVGESGLATFKMILYQMQVAGQLSEHDHKIGSKLAYVLCGGDLTSLHFVSEQYILDLEREAFLSLCGEAKTMERIKHTLKTGKPLRN